MKITELKKIISNSRYIVSFCGSGMLMESGILNVREQSRAYEIEQKYGYSPEEIMSSSFYSTRPEKFYEFYRRELLTDPQIPGESFYALAKLQEVAPVKSIITSDIYSYPDIAGCRNVIELHGNIHSNQCDKCGAIYNGQYIRSSLGRPRCGKCGGSIRPGIILFGDMVNNRLMTRAATEISHADTILFLGSTLKSDLAERYVKYFEGEKLILINPEEDFYDDKADIAIHAPISETLHELNRYLETIK